MFFLQQSRSRQKLPGQHPERGNDMITDDNGYNLIPVSTLNSPAVSVSVVPESGFASDTQSPSVGQTVTFTDQSTGNPASWHGTSETVRPQPSRARRMHTLPPSQDGYSHRNQPGGHGYETKTDYINVVSQPVRSLHSAQHRCTAPLPLSVTSRTLHQLTDRVELGVPGKRNHQRQLDLVLDSTEPDLQLRSRCL